VLQNLNLEINCRHTGVMGESGCGKSTILQMMMRFYDPDEGRVTLDGVDLREFDLPWLRQQIGYIGQEPLLFSTTIRENLLIGKRGATEEELIEALLSA
jgi:ATP-binding cassette, subfamily B (MDR/TAP), member 1